MDGITRNLFNVIFQEAHVVDFDFSKWDRQLRLVVVAGLAGGNFEGRGQVHNVDFVEVSEFSWHAKHFPAKPERQDEYFQWVIMDFSVKEHERSERILLTGFGPTPNLEIVCRDIRISSMDPRVIDSVNPNWNRPAMALARPDFETLFALKRGQ